MRGSHLIFLVCLLWALTVTGCGDAPQPVNTNSAVNTNATVNSSPAENPLKNLSNVAFNTPEKMRLNETQHIQFLLSPNVSTGELAGRIEEEGKVETRAGVRTSDRVEAVLTGSGFKITELTPKEQDISLDATEPVAWKWEIKALEGGPQRLDLTLNSVVPREGVVTRRSVRSFDATILIDVTLQDRITTFVGNNWQWLWTTLLVPVGTAIFVSLRRRRAKAA